MMSQRIMTMNDVECCKDPKKCGHYIKRRRHASVHFDEYTEEYMACSQAGILELLHGGPERCKCPYERGDYNENK